MSKSKIAEMQEQSQQYWISLYESRQTNKILSGTVIGIEHHGGELCAIVFYEAIRIIIPQASINALPEPETEEEKKKRVRIMYAIIGSTIDFIVEEIDRENEIVIASRKKAMEIRRKELVKLKENQKIKCKIMAVAQKVAIAEAYGVEVKLLAKDVTWGFVDDLRNCLSVGDELDAIVSKIDLDKETFHLSIRDVTPDPFTNAGKLFSVDHEYLGTVSLIREGGIFVRLKDGIDTMCPHPGWTNLKLNHGDMVLVRIRSIDVEKRRVKSLILRLIKRAHSI